MPQGVVVCLRIQSMKVYHAAQKIIATGDRFRPIAFTALDGGALKLPCNRVHDVRRHLILQVEDVFEDAVITVRPNMHPVRGVDQLASDPYPVARFSHAAFQHIMHAKLAAHLPYIDGPAFVGEAEELQAATNSQLVRDSAVTISSTMPSLKQSCCGSPLRLSKGSTAMEGRS